MSGEKIRIIRELRGYSQEFVANKLGIAQNTYSKIETEQSKLTVKMLNKISDVLGVSPTELLNNEPAIINFASNQGTQCLKVEHLYTYQKEQLEKIIDSKDHEISKLENIINGLLKDKERLMTMLDKKYK
jgi:transcriptional regulator with XRE-family HTH domain